MSYVVFGSGVVTGVPVALVVLRSAAAYRRYTTHPNYLSAKRRVKAAKERAHG